MDKHPWQNRDGAPAFVTTAPGSAIADALAQALERVRLHARRMEQAMEQDDVRLVLKAACDMLAELSAAHNPKNYSNLYAEVFTHLQQLPYFFQDYVSQGHDTYDSLYCVTQHAGHVLPRLYLMIICASCAMKADPKTIPSYLSDLLDFCKGVQHPMRGLFLRSFLNTYVRELLPDVEDPSSTDGAPASSPEPQTPAGPSEDAYDEDSSALVSVTFLLRNFSEMNKLWTRMQRNLPPSDARDVVRKQLAELVGKNLNQLAGLGGLTFQHYRGLVLPGITEQIVHCEDKLAQRFLMEILIMSFPDKYHVHTLQQLLDTCLLLQPGVEIDSILTLLIQRISEHASSTPDTVPITDRSAFTMLLTTARECGIRHTTMPAAGAVAMFQSLADFVGEVYGGDDEMMNAVLEAAHEGLQQRGHVADPSAESSLLALLQRPLKDFKLERLVKLGNMALLMRMLRPPKQRQLAIEIIEAVADSGTKVAQAADMAVLAQMAGPLVDAQTPSSETAEEECTDSLAALCKLARTIDTSSVPTAHAVTLALRDAFGHMPSPEPIEALGHVLLAAYSNHAAKHGHTSVSSGGAAGATLASSTTAAAGGFGALAPPPPSVPSSGTAAAGGGGPGSVGGGSSGASSPTKSSAASAADAAAAARSGAASALKAASALSSSSDLGLNSFKGTGSSGPGAATSGAVTGNSGTSATRSGDNGAKAVENETSKQFGWLHSSIVVMLEDRSPASAVRMLLRGCEVAGELGEGKAAESLLSSALAVYERYCALPPSSVSGLVAMMQCLRGSRCLSEACVKDVAARLRRYCTSLPVREQKVQMLCNLAHVYWQKIEPGQPKPPVCDAEAAKGVLREALELCAKAEALFRGERWSNPALLYMAVLDTCQSLSSAGCSMPEIEKQANVEVSRLAKGPCKSVGVLEPLNCWTPELQTRWELLQT